MSVLFNLPDDLYRSIQCEWLPMIALGFLDSSICSKQWRKTFLSQLSVLKGVSPEKGVLLFHEWATARHIPLYEVTLKCGSLSAREKIALAPQWTNIRALNMLYHNDASCINKCSNLTMLKISSVRAISVPTGVLSGLLGIDISFESDPTMMLTDIGLHCRKLNNFKLETARREPDSSCRSLLMKIFETNPLEKISVPMNDSLLNKLVECCSSTLKRIYSKGAIDMCSVTATLRSCKSLKYVHIVGREFECFFDVDNELLDLSTIHADPTLWKDLLTELPHIRQVQLFASEFGSVDVFLPLFESTKVLVELHIVHAMISGTVVYSILELCKDSLRVLYLAFKDDYVYVDSFPDSNRLEKVVLSQCKDWKVILTKCLYLRSVHIKECCFRLEEIDALTALIQSYKHIVTGHTLDIQCNGWLMGGYGTDKTLVLRFDNGQFCGSLWVKHQKLCEIFQTKEEAQLKREIAELKRENVELKLRLSQYEKV